MLFAGVYILGISLFYLFQKQLIFRPKKLAKGYTFDFQAQFQEYFFDTPDGEQVNALFFPTSNNSSKGVVLYFHGNADNLKRWAKYYSDFTSRGYDFLVMDYRGYGKSTGAIDEDAF